MTAARRRTASRALLHHAGLWLLMASALLSIGQELPAPARVAACAVGSGVLRPRVSTLVGHRGSERPLPENTIAAAVRGARAVGFVEVDLALTRDARVVLLHDSTLDRTTRGSGRVCSRTFDEVRALVPTLSSLFAALPNSTHYMLDVKRCHPPHPHPPTTLTPAHTHTPCPGSCAALAARVRVLARRYGIGHAQLTFTSTSTAALGAFPRAFPGASFALSVAHTSLLTRPGDVAEHLRANGFDAVSMLLAVAVLRPGLVRYLEEVAGVRVFAWTARSRWEMRLGACAGVEALIVADPVAAKKGWS